MKIFATQEDAVSTDVLPSSAANGIAVITIGSPKRIHFDAEMAAALNGGLTSRRECDGFLHLEQYPPSKALP
jgi:hypothetical protein